MFKSPVLKSGGPPVEYPKTIWTPVGGWYVKNANWKRNTAIAFVGLFFAGSYIFRTSIEYERRLKPGIRPIPSQRWATHALEDDPLYPQKLAEYKKNKKPLWERIFQTAEDFKEE